MRELVDTEIYNDFSQPNGMLDCTGLVYDFDPALPPAALLYYHESEQSKPFGERGLALLRLLMPAFKAGVQSCLRLSTRRAALGELFDKIDSALACFDAKGNVVQQNSAMTRLLSAEPQRDRLLAQISAAANAMASTMRQLQDTSMAKLPQLPGVIFEPLPSAIDSAPACFPRGCSRRDRWSWWRSMCWTGSR